METFPPLNHKPALIRAFKHTTQQEGDSEPFVRACAARQRSRLLALSRSFSLCPVTERVCRGRLWLGAQVHREEFGALVASMFFFNKLYAVRAARALAHTGLALHRLAGVRPGRLGQRRPHRLCVRAAQPAHASASVCAGREFSAGLGLMGVNVAEVRASVACVRT